MFFFFIRRNFVESWFFMAFFKIFAALAAAVSKAVQFSDSKDFSRKSALTAETVIRRTQIPPAVFLERVVLDRAHVIRRTQIPPAVFRAVFDQFNSACADNELFRGYRLLAVDGEISAKRLFCFMAARFAPAEQSAGMPGSINCALWNSGRSTAQSQSLYHLPKKSA